MARIVHKKMGCNLNMLGGDDAKRINLYNNVATRKPWEEWGEASLTLLGRFDRGPSLSGNFLKHRLGSTVRRWLPITLLVVCVFLVFPALAGSQYPELRNRFDPDLQNGLEHTLERLGLAGAVRRRDLSVALVDVTDLERPRVATVNGDHMIYAASLPKIAILLGAFVEIERGDMVLDDATRTALTDMIRVSSNSAATAMLRRVGKPRLAEILQSNRYRLYDPAFNGGLWVGKDYGKTPAWRRDPLHNLSHGATAFQAARFYYLLETNQLVSAQLSREMKEMLSKPAIRHKFVKGLEARPDARIYRKSGSWKRWHSDSALVERAGHKYIVVALARNSKAGQWMSELIGSMDDLIVRTQITFGDSALP